MFFYGVENGANKLVGGRQEGPIMADCFFNCLEIMAAWRNGK